MNEVLRDWYVGDCQAGVTRWNKILERHGFSDRLRLPDRKFNRGIGMFSSLHFDPEGRQLSDDEWDRAPVRVAALPGGPGLSAQHHERAGVRGRASSPTTSRRRNVASRGSRSTSSTCARSDGHDEDPRRIARRRLHDRAERSAGEYLLVRHDARDRCGGAGGAHGPECPRRSCCAVPERSSSVPAPTSGCSRTPIRTSNTTSACTRTRRLNRLEQTPKLVIAALNGHTVGGGLEVALAADIRIAKKDAGKMGLPEVALGVLPGTGGTQRLARLIGKGRAIELMATGRLISMDEARNAGLVHEVWGDEELKGRSFADAVHDYARQFTPPTKASRAVGRMKRAVQSGTEAGFLEGPCDRARAAAASLSERRCQRGLDGQSRETEAVVQRTINGDNRGRTQEALHQQRMARRCGRQDHGGHQSRDRGGRLPPSRRQIEATSMRLCRRRVRR